MKQLIRTRQRIENLGYVDSINRVFESALYERTYWAACWFLVGVLTAFVIVIND